MRKLPKNGSPCCKVSVANLGICHKRLLLKSGLKCLERVSGVLKNTDVNYNLFPSTLKAIYLCDSEIFSRI